MTRAMMVTLLGDLVEVIAMVTVTVHRPARSHGAGNEHGDGHGDCVLRSCKLILRQLICLSRCMLHRIWPPMCLISSTTAGAAAPAGRAAALSSSS
mmetsp:Transcript_69474/g.196875  ORF Transcript_69474/g.196875 Transcript_69474/m.196875 type:complete len:96 (-) Transcript_69474:118-405(-)